MSTPRGRDRLLSVVGTALLAVVAALYIFQSTTMAPNHTDEGLIIGYIDDMAHGQRPFFHFVDAYGILNWIFPVLFYKAFGEEVFGIHVWMLVVKVVAFLVAFGLVLRLTGAPVPGAADDRPRRDTRGLFYALLSSLFMLMLLGAAWQSLETAYAFVTVIPLTLGTWYFIVVEPFRAREKNVYAAAFLTAVTIWTKLNTGMYLLAGGLFTYFFWMPVHAGSGAPEPASDRARTWLLRARVAGGIGYAILFTLYIRQHFNVWFFLYLTVPLAIGVGWTLLVTAKRAPRELSVRDHVSPWLAYLLTSVGLSLAVLFGYYGRRTGRYLQELVGILSSIRYTAPFPPLGKPGLYVGLNEYYWLELPWLLTLLYVVWVLVAEKAGPRTYGDAWPRKRAQTSSLFVLLTLHSFVMYARCDETHIYQMLVLAVPVLFVVIGQLEAFAYAYYAPVRYQLRLLLAGLSVMYCQSLLVVPDRGSFDISQSDWHNPKLRHLRYRKKLNQNVRDFSADVTDHEWDATEDAAAEYVKSISFPGEDMLLLMSNRLLYYNSETRPIGGRYHFFFYLASVGLLDREGFDKLVPKEVIQDILERPPRVIVSSIGFVPLAEVFPEFVWLRETWYQQTHHFRHILIYELRIDGEPVPAPLR
jgi:hypothetical protein